MDRMQLMTSVTLVHAAEQPTAGLIDLHAADLMPIFRRDGSGRDEVRVFRIRPQGQTGWVFVTSPEAGVAVVKSDILINATEVTRFEAENAMVRRSSSAQPSSKYDWEAMYVAVIKRIHEHGLPESQTDFVSEFQEWFVRRDSNGEAPDERSIRRRLNPIWRSLREAT